MNFVILRNEGTMSIDNALIDLDTSPWIAWNVEIVTWRGDTGSGFIEYNNIARVMYKTTRLEDYIGPLQHWINTAWQLGLSPWQAQRIMIDVVDMMYNNKRIASYWHGGWEFDGADEAVAHMAALVASTGAYDRIDHLVGQTNGALAAKTNEINSNVVGVNNGNASRVQPWLNQNANNWLGLQMDRSGRQSIPGGQSGPYQGVPTTDQAWLTHSHPVTIDRITHVLQGFSAPGAGGFLTMGGMSGASVAGEPNPDVTWHPLTPATQIAIPSITFRDILRAIISRRVNLDSMRAAKKRAIEQAPTIPQILAVDVVGGW